MSGLNVIFKVVGIKIVIGILVGIGEDTISHFILNKPILGPMICGLIGLIPNCAASVIIAQLYLGNMISAGTMIAGLLVGSGVGLLILFRINPKRKENWKVVSILYGTGVFFGIFLEMIGLTL